MSLRGTQQQRREILDSEIFEKTNDHDLHWKLSKNTMYSTFVEGDSPLESAERIVSQMLNERETRQKTIATVRLEDISVDSFSISMALRDYVDLGRGHLPWLLDAIAYRSNQEKIVTSFGCLAKLLPEVRYDEVCDLRNKYINDVSIVIGDIIFSPLTVDDNALIEDSSQDETDTPSRYISQHIASFMIEPIYSELIYWHLLGTEHCDSRVAALLAYPSNCPWQSAKDAVAALREERKKRIIQIDSELPEWCMASTIPLWNLTTCVQPRTVQDKEDDICDCHYDNPRADYINGKLTIEKAMSRMVRKAREDILRNALRQGFLHSKLISTNRLCKEFVNTPGTTDAMESLSRLILTLQHEKSERIRLLDAVFDQAKVSEPDLKMASSYVDSDLSTYGDIFIEYLFETYEEMCDEFYDSDRYPSTMEVCELKYRYIDLGEGLTEEVLRVAVMCQRKEQVKAALGNHFKGWYTGKIESWMHSSELCATFVSRTEDGIPTDEDMDMFLSKVAQLPSAELKEAYHDTDLDGGDEWKYHMSGGDYGNDPDGDAMWNSYWDC